VCEGWQYRLKSTIIMHADVPILKLSFDGGITKMETPGDVLPNLGCDLWNWSLLLVVMR
jgi:hypothetical protein